MSILELVTKSRSYRGYNEDRAVSKEELTSLVECARLCPSSVNKQPLKFYLAWEREEAKRILSLTKWARGLPDMTLPHPGMGPTAFVVIMQDTDIDDSLTRYMKDVGIVAQTMLLRAAEMGLGGCMIGNFSAAEVKSELKLPENYAPLLVVAIGEPKEEIVLTGLREDGGTGYYRDENDVHYVPKRSLSDIIVTEGDLK